jgi:hypothetical protein
VVELVLLEILVVVEALFVLVAMDFLLEAVVPLDKVAVVHLLLMQQEATTLQQVAEVRVILAQAVEQVEITMVVEAVLAEAAEAVEEVGTLAHKQVVAAVAAAY